MNTSIIVVWLVVITIFSFIGSWYARKNNKPDLLIGLYVTFVLVAQVLAAKVALFTIGGATFMTPAAVLVYATTYLLTDVVNERFGRRATQNMITIALVSQIAMVCFFWLGVVLPPAPFWELQTAWAQIFGLVPRITAASWVAFYLSESFDAQIFAWFRQVTHGRHLWARNVFSSLPALLLDTVIFVPLAFAGSMPLMPLMIGQVTMKWLVGLVDIPFMYVNKMILGEKTEEK